MAYVVFLKEWNEACAYAGECLPPFVYDLTRDPWPALAFIVLVCGGLYLWNERRRSNKNEGVTI